MDNTTRAAPNTAVSRTAALDSVSCTCLDYVNIQLVFTQMGF